MQKTKIDWGIPGLLTWNPVTGCRRGCSYCYARRIYERFNKEPFTTMTLHGDRLGEPTRLKKPSTIFVGSMTDLEYWNKEWRDLVVAVCRAHPQHTFMFLSKEPNSYHGIEWPSNTMQGLTITKIVQPMEAVNVTQIICFPRPFLSIEPLLGRFIGIIPTKWPLEKIIVGSQTGPGAVVPKPEWIQSIKDSMPADKIYWKPNMRKYL